MSKVELLKSYINKVRARAKRHGLNPDKIKISNRAGKKFVYEDEESGRKIHFGSLENKDYHQYKLEKNNPEEHRRKYRARHGVIRVTGGKLAHEIRLSPAWMSWNLLW